MLLLNSMKLFVCVIISLLFTEDLATELYRKNCLNLTGTATNQRQLDLFLQDVIFSNSRNTTTKCIQLSLIGDSFNLDLLQLMRVNLGTNGSLMIVSDSVIINCSTNVTDLEELRDTLQPISRALLVLFDGLVFTKCPVPIVIEEVSNVMIQNCVFL